MPAMTADYYGPRNVGANYGLLFTAFGVSGFFMPRHFAQIQDFRLGLLAAIDYRSNRLHRSRFSHFFFLPSDFSGPGRGHLWLLRARRTRKCVI